MPESRHKSGWTWDDRKGHWKQNEERDLSSQREERPFTRQTLFIFSIPIKKKKGGGGETKFSKLGDCQAGVWNN